MTRLATRSGSFLPTASEHFLLRAALLDDAGAVRASLAEWTARVALDAVDHGSLRLLPLLYRNLQRHAIELEAMPRLKGIYRQSWFRNRMVLGHGLHALRALRAENLPAILLKGAALAAAVYDEIALRPMDDFDVLVPRERFREAVTLLERDGWRMHPAPADRETYLAFRHAVGFVRGDGGNLDLHWASIRDRFDRRGEEEFWRASIPATLAGEPVRVLAPVDQLLQICAHASLRNGVAPIRWIADTWFLLRRETPFDWERVVRMARRRSLSFTILRCLEYLHDGLGVDIPRNVMRALGRDSGLLSRLGWRLRNRDGRGILVYVASVWMRHVFASSFREVPGRLRRLPGFARAYFGVDSLSLFFARRLLK